MAGIAIGPSADLAVEASATLIKLACSISLLRDRFYFVQDVSDQEV